jgi:hypothetical protein
MYRINKERTFTRDVTVIFPDPNKEGKDSKGTLTATFKLLPQSEFEEALDLGDVDFLRKVLKRVSGIGDESGNPVPDEEAMEAVLDDSCAVSAMVAEYLECTKGKNFRRKRSR